MIETLYNARGLDETRVKRAFRLVITFRDFPEGSWQTVDGDSMMIEALTLFTKGRAEFFLDGVQRGDRVPGILSSEYEPVGAGGTSTIKYVEPTTRVCIPKSINHGQLPRVKKFILDSGARLILTEGQKILVCLGEVSVKPLDGEAKIFKAEQNFTVGSGTRELTALKDVILLEFE